MAKTGKDALPYLTQTIYTTNPPLGNNNLGTPFTGDGGKINVLSLGNTIGNANLSPEFLTEYEVGTDLQMFENRFRLDFTYYYRKSTDQIINVTTAPSSGFNFIVENLGEAENKGIEVTLGATPLRLSNGFTWDMTHTFTRNRSKVISLGDLEEVFVGGFTGLGIVHRPGLPYGMILGTDILRDAEDGMPLINGDTGLMIDNPNDQLIGDPNPDFIWTLMNTFSWKGLSLNFLLDWRKGGDQFCFNCGQMRSRGVTTETLYERESGRVIQGYIADPADPTQALRDNEGNKVVNNIQISANDMYFIDGVSSSGAFIHDTYDISTIRLREVSLGYSFPQAWLSKTPFGSAFISISGRNLWFEAYNTPTSLNYDPEVASVNGNGRGIDLGAAPTTRRYGVNLRFTF